MLSPKAFRVFVKAFNGVLSATLQLNWKAGAYPSYKTPLWCEKLPYFVHHSYDTPGTVVGPGVKHKQKYVFLSRRWISQRCMIFVNNKRQLNMQWFCGILTRLRHFQIVQQGVGTLSLKVFASVILARWTSWQINSRYILARTLYFSSLSFRVYLRTNSLLALRLDRTLF